MELVCWELEELDVVFGGSIREWVGTVRRIVTNKVGFSWLPPLRLQTTEQTLGGRGVHDLRNGSELWEAPAAIMTSVMV